MSIDPNLGASTARLYHFQNLLLAISGQQLALAIVLALTIGLVALP